MEGAKILSRNDLNTANIPKPDIFPVLLELNQSHSIFTFSPWLLPNLQGVNV